MDNSKYLKTVIIDKLIENEANMVEDVTIEEARLNLYLNGEKAISMMTIPKDQDAHAIGFLMSENVISSIADFTDNICGGECIVLYSVPEAEHFYKRNYFQNFKSFMSPDQSIVNEDCVPMFYML